MTGAVDQTPLMRPGQLLFAAADENHLPVERQQLGFIQLRSRFGLHVCFLVYGDHNVLSQDSHASEQALQLKCMSPPV
jgi:hypothetical protein